MAEAIMRRLAGDGWEVFSAGHLATPIHPMVPQVLSEIGVPMSGQRSKHRREMAGQRFDFAVTLCAHAREVFPRVAGAEREEFWDIEDPYGVEGSEEEVREVFRRVRDALLRRIEQFLRRVA
jgi:arsenate reductase